MTEVPLLLLKELQESGRISAINPPVNHPGDPRQNHTDRQPHLQATAGAATRTHFHCAYCTVSPELIDCSSSLSIAFPDELL